MIHPGDRIHFLIKPYQLKYLDRLLISSSLEKKSAHSNGKTKRKRVIFSHDIKPQHSIEPSVFANAKIPTCCRKIPKNTIKLLPGGFLDMVLLPLV